MTSAVEKYLDDLKRRGAEAVRFLNNGSQHAGEKLALAHPELSVPPDLLTMWRVFDGLSYDQPSKCDQVWLEGAFYVLSEQEAVDDYAACLSLWADDPEFKDYWPNGFFPFAKPGDGSRLLVNCVPESSTHGAVYELFHGVGVSKSANSISDYFVTALAWLKEGATRLDDRSYVERDFEASRLIAARLNPDCDRWDDSLPPASVTKDWLR